MPASVHSTAISASKATANPELFTMQSTGGAALLLGRCRKDSGGVQGCDLRVDGMLDVAVLDWSAGMAELGAVGHEVGLQLGHILALEDVPNSPCSSVTAPYTLSQLAYEIHIHTHMYTLNPVYIHTLNPVYIGFRVYICMCVRACVCGGGGCGNCVLVHVVGDASAWLRWPKGRQEISNVKVKKRQPCKACKESMRKTTEWKGGEWRAANGRVKKQWAAMQTTVLTIKLALLISNSFLVQP